MDGQRQKPIPVRGIGTTVKPNLQMPIRLFWEALEGINWDKGEPVSKAQLEEAISRSAGLHLPNEILPALDPSDVLVLRDGIFWIDRDWILQPLSEAELRVINFSL